MINSVMPWQLFNVCMSYSFYCCSQSCKHQHLNVAFEHEIIWIECDIYPTLYFKILILGDSIHF